MSRNRIIYGQTGQVLRHVPMGPVSGASYVIEDLVYPVGSSERTIGSGTPTVASWTVTSNATAGITQTNGKRISTASTEGASIGAPAVIVAPDGGRELFEVEALTVNSYLEATSTLAGVYPSGSTVYGVEITCPVPDDFAADLDELRRNHPIRVTWTYTLDGVVHRIPEFVEWVRHTQGADQLLGAVTLWLAKAYPDCRERLPDDGHLDTVVELMADEVANDIRARRRNPEQFLVGDRGRSLIVARVLMHLGELGWAPGSTEIGPWAEMAARRYMERLDSLTVGEPGNATAETDKSEDTSGETPSRKYGSIFLQM